MKINIHSLLSERVPGLEGDCLLMQSACGCTRCNACVQSCPAYLKYLQESFSPRGRAQLIRLLAENKLHIEQDQALLQDIVKSCVLCARCSAACAAHIPVASYMLALSKHLAIKRAPRTLVYAIALHNEHPVAFNKLASLFLWLRRIKLVYLLRPLLPAWLRRADKLLPRRQTKTLYSLLTKQKLDLTPAQPQVVYLPSLYASYADIEAGYAVLQLLKNKRTYVLCNYSSGLAEYLYGQSVWVRRAAKRLLMRWEKLGGRQGITLVTDSIEVYGFLMQYPLLFAQLPGWKKRAQRMVKHVKYVAELPSFKTGVQAAHKLALETSSVLYPAEPQVQRARKILLTNNRKNLLECEYSRFPLPAAGLGFARPAQAEELVHQHVQDIARKEIADVYCLSGWAALELNAALKRLYPKARAQHLIFAHREYGRTQEGKRAVVRRREAKPAR